MKADQLAVGVTLESVPVSLVPANCELLARTYVGDLEYAVARAPKDRALFLLAAGVAWRVNLPLLLANFADELRAWDRNRELMLGIQAGRVTRRPRLVNGKRRAG